MNRRELLKALAAGGVMTAAGLWMPGQKLISIPDGVALKSIAHPNRLILPADIVNEALRALRRSFTEVMEVEIRSPSDRV